MYGIKLRMIRELRGFSQEYVANSMGLAQSTYSKYENNQVRISVEILQKLAEVLEVSPMDIMGPGPAIINFEQNHNTIFDNIDALIIRQKKLYEQLLVSKDAEIDRMHLIINNLISKK